MSQPPDKKAALDAIESARQARLFAYAPYSRFQVGCALVCADGSVFRGCNVETANYDAIHAEESALSSMVGSGRRDPVLCVCVGGAEGQEPIPISSCGKCRQALWEFASLSGRELLLIVSVSNGEPSVSPLSELLPHAFGPADLGIELGRYR